VKLRHEKEVKELKWMIEMEQEDKAAAIRKSAETFTSYKAKMTKQIAAMSTDYANQVSQLSTTIDNLVEDKNATSLRMDAIQEELAVKKLAIDEMATEINSKNKSLDEKTLEIVELMEQIKIFKAEDEGLKSAVEALVASNKEHVQQMKVLEDDLVIKTATIVSLTSDIKNLNATCDEMALEKASISEQLEQSQVTSDKLEMACEDLESINADYASALERLASSMQEMKERNEALTDRIEEVNLTNNKLRKNKNANDEKLIETMDELERVTTELNGERVGHEKEIEEIKRIFETFVYMSEETLGDVTSQMTSQMSAQNVNMAYLAKSLEEAKLDIRQKDTLLQEKNAEIQRYIDDLEAQRGTSQCDVLGSFSDFWSSSE
jgi:chromosome segregation ATPase